MTPTSLILKTLAIVSIGLFTSLSQADIPMPNKTPKGVITTTIKSLDLDPSDTYFENVIGGNVKIDYNEKNIQLSLYKKFYCPPHQLCAMMMPAPILIELPILEIKRGTCNETITVAQKDDRPVDGIFQSIKITNFQTATCRFFVAPQNTLEITKSFYDRIHGNEVKTHSKMNLNTFKKIESETPTPVLENPEALAIQAFLDLQTTDSSSFPGLTEALENLKKQNLKSRGETKALLLSGMCGFAGCDSTYLVTTVYRSLGANTRTESLAGIVQFHSYSKKAEVTKIVDLKLL
jgi:hypothetical protein